MQTLERAFFMGRTGSTMTLKAGWARMCQEQKENRFGQWSSAREHDRKTCGQWARDQVITSLIVTGYASVC